MKCFPLLHFLFLLSPPATSEVLDRIPLLLSYEKGEESQSVLFSLVDDVHPLRQVRMFCLSHEVGEEQCAALGEEMGRRYEEHVAVRREEEEEEEREFSLLVDVLPSSSSSSSSSSSERTIRFTKGNVHFKINNFCDEWYLFPEDCSSLLIRGREIIEAHEEYERISENFGGRKQQKEEVKEEEEGKPKKELLHFIPISLSRPDGTTRPLSWQLFDRVDPMTQAEEFIEKYEVTEEYRPAVLQLVKEEYAQWSSSRMFGVEENYEVVGGDPSSPSPSSTCSGVVIRPSPMLSVANHVVEKVSTSEHFSPSFFVGAERYMAETVRRYLQEEEHIFSLIKHHILRSHSKQNSDNDRGDDIMRTRTQKIWRGVERRVAIDLGANRGFYTHFLAALGMEVHAFEIQPKMLKLNQHGRVFNTDGEIPQLVHLYQLGISDATVLMSFLDFGGGGHSSSVEYGHEEHATVQMTTLDCFLLHLQLISSEKGTRDSSRLFIDFLKIDIKGFEMAAMKGGKAFFSHEHVTIGAMLMEAGPGRWGKSGVSLEEGVGLLRDLYGHQFQSVYILLRGDDHCPNDLKYVIERRHGAIGPDRIVGGNQMFLVPVTSLESLMAKMLERNNDCNFWME